jgi:hypothetical protein
MMNGGRSNSVFVAPLSKRLCNAIYREHRGLSRISRLFFGRSPSTILGKVTFAIVDPINTVLGAWSWTHVFKKVLKTVPSLAYGYSTILVESHVFDDASETTMSHSIPHFVLWRSIKTMFNVCRNCPLSLKTPTAKCMAASKIHQSDFSFNPTVAPNKDLSMSIFHRKFHYCEPSVSITNPRSWFTHTAMLATLQESVKEIAI